MIPVVAAVLAACIGTTAGTGTPLVGPGFSPAFVLTDEARDSLAFEADSLVPNPGMMALSLHGAQQSLWRPATRVLFLHIRTQGRLAVLVDSAGAPPWTVESARRALIERQATAPSSPHPLAQAHDGFEFPRDWYRRAELELANGFDLPIRVTWVAFDAIEERELMRAAALQSLGLRSAPRGSPEEAGARPGALSEEALRLTVRIVGEVRIDPRTGRIER